MTSPSNTPQTSRPPLLPDLLAQVTAERVLDTARRVESKRSEDAERRLIAHHGLADRMLWTTPYMWQAAAAAQRQGIIAFDRLERDHLEAPPAWVHPEIGSGYYRVAHGPEVVHAPSLWPFAQDMAVADYESRTSGKWWSHGLVHALVGFGWWPGLTEWELMAMTRLSEALAATHWYNLAELGRLAQEDMPIELRWLRGYDAVRYARLEERAQRPDVRKARLGDPVGPAIVDNMLETLRYEAYAFRSAMWQGDLFDPSDPLYLDLGEAAEYAKVHIARLGSSAHARWRESCLVPERDYATSSDAFERRAAAALKDILFYAEVGEPDARLRGRRVLQDVGWRVCHHGALVGHDAEHERALVAVADAIRAIDADPAADGDGEVAAALASAHAALGAGAAKRVLTLGYRPTLDPAREPEVARDVRAAAFVERTHRIHRVFGAAFDALLPLARRAVSAPRTRELIAPLVQLAEDCLKDNEIPLEGYGYVGWLAVPYALWFEHGPERVPLRWSYRIARRRMPEDPARWDDYSVAWNPYLQRMPLPFDARWNDELRRTAPGTLKRFKPRPATAAYYVLIGPGRDAPVYLPVTPHLNALMQLLRVPRRLGELARSRDFGADYMRQAIADEAVLIFHAPQVDREERNIDVIETAMQQVAGISQRREEPGPWNEEDQAEAYLAFCQSSTLYRDTSAALVDFVGIPPAGRIGELGSGTGETTAAILERLGPEGRVLGTDPAVRMLELLMQRFADDMRAAFVIGAARTLAFSAAGQRGFDRVIANSSIVLTDDIEVELAIVRRALEPGGKVAFSMPSEFVGLSDHLQSDEAIQVLTALTAAQSLVNAERDGKPADAALGSLDNLRRAMTAAGYEDLRFEVYRRPWPAREYIDWLAQPVVAKALVGKANEERAGELIAELRRRVDPELPLEAAWLLASGTRPIEAQAQGETE